MDPDEGELLIAALDLFADPPVNTTEIWEEKDNFLHTVNFTTPYGNIPTQQGYYFSAHEQWKYMILPYRDVLDASYVLSNTEKSRTWYSTVNCLSGLLSETNAAEKNVTETEVNSPIPSQL